MNPKSKYNIEMISETPEERVVEVTLDGNYFTQAKYQRKTGMVDIIHETQEFSFHMDENFLEVMLELKTLLQGYFKEDSPEMI